MGNYTSFIIAKFELLIQGKHPNEEFVKKTIFIWLVSLIIIPAQSAGVHFLPVIVDSNKNITQDRLFNMAFEVNPASILVGSAYDSFTITGGILNYSLDRNAELALPFMYFTELSGDNRDHTLILDFCYRRFVSEYQKGFYINAALRIAHFSENNDTYYVEPLSGEYYYRNNRENIMKLGIGFGIGYRLITRHGFVWGVSITVGRYLNNLKSSSHSSEYSFPSYVSERIYFDMELLKIGYAF